MSYINDALHKVQKEKESPYAAFGGILATGDKQPSGKRKKVLRIAGFMAVILIILGVAAMLYRMPDKRNITATPRPAPVSPAVAKAPAKGIPAADNMVRPQDKPPVTAQAVVPPVVKAPPREIPVNRVVETKAEKKETAAAAAGDRPQTVLPDAGTEFSEALQAQREGRLDEAKELYKQVIRKEPRHLQALNNLGVVYLKMKRYKWAVIRLNDALNIKQDYLDAHYNLACLYAQKNDTKKSLYYLKNAVDINPEVRQWASRDDDFKSLARLPEFNKILQSRDN